MRNINRTTNDNQYQRLNIEDAEEWRNSGKQKYLPTQEAENISTTPHSDTILHLEATAEEAHFKRWHVPRLGTMTTHRPDGVYRIMGAQLNNISSVERRDKKVTEIKNIIDKWDVQGGCFQEVGINWSAINYNRNMASWFRLDRNEIRTHTAHNVNLAQLMCKDLVAYTRDTETDFRGLGRWASWVLYSNPAHRTRIVTAYNLGKRKSNYLGTCYQQHLRYIQRNGLNVTPHTLFLMDFVEMITKWMSAGERLLIFIDMNEHVIRGNWL